MIPMVDLKAQYAEIKDEVEEGLKGVFESCHFVLGPHVDGFEKESAQYLGVNHAVGVASGTDALHLALDASGVGEGDEVITTAFTFIATAEAIRYVGATPIFVDIDPRTFNICPDAVRAAVSSKTAAVVPVHLFGQPVDMSPLRELCAEHDLKLVEDCAQSFGASTEAGHTGSLGDCGAFSFFPSKNLGAFGDGGLITTDSDELAERARVLRNHGSKERYYHDFVGYNSRLDEIQAMILRVKLKRIDEYNAARREVAHLYSKLLSGLPLATPHEDGTGIHVYHQYTILSERRDDIIAALKKQGIASAIYYPIPLHRQNVFRAQYSHLVLPVTEEISSRCLSFPIYPELTEADVRIIADAVKNVFVD